jgi:hypothetical protein
MRTKWFVGGIALVAALVAGSVAIAFESHKSGTEVLHVSAPSEGTVSESIPIWHAVSTVGSLPGTDLGWIGTDTQIVLTTDGGTTFVSASIPPAGPPLDVTFTSPNSAMAVVGGATPNGVDLYRTTDGASTWSDASQVQIASGGQIAGASLVTTHGQWWLLLTEASSSNFSFGRVFKSLDGGTWSEVSEDSPGGRFLVDGSAIPLIEGGPGHGRIYRSDDGKSWAAIDLQQVLGDESYSFGPAASLQGEALVGGRSTGEPQRAVVVDLKTGDATLSFDEHSTLIPTPIDADRTLLGGSIYDVDGSMSRVEGDAPTSDISLVGNSGAIGVFSNEKCTNGTDCHSTTEIVRSSELDHWTVVSSASTQPSPPETTTTGVTPTGPLQTLASGTYDSKDWQLNAAPARNGFCYVLGYGSPKSAACRPIPEPMPAVVATVNQDPPVAVGIVRPDVSSIVVTFLSETTVRPELRDPPAGYAQYRWYVLEVPAGETVIAQRAYGADGALLG